MAIATQSLTERARALHADSVVIDGCHCAPMTIEHFPRLKAGGIAAVNFTSCRVDVDLQEAARDVGRLLNIIDLNADTLTVVREPDDILHAREQGKVGIIIGMQNARPMMDDLVFFRFWYEVGVRIVQLTYNERNLIGDGCVEAANSGLSRYGQRVVAEMNRLGMLVDLSHCGEQTTKDAIEVSTRPVAITHANAKALTPSVRNKEDSTIRRLAEKGGIIGAAFWAPLTYRDAQRRPVFEDFLDHVDHLVQVAGIDHVGVGSDLGEGENRAVYESKFMGPGMVFPEVTGMLGGWYTFDDRMVDGLGSTVNFPDVTEGLLRRGYGDDDVRKLLGGNFLRVVREAL